MLLLYTKLDKQKKILSKIDFRFTLVIISFAGRMSDAG